MTPAEVRAGLLAVLDERDRLRAEAEALADVLDTLRADAERWRFVRRKVCFSGIGDGTAHMDIINLPISAKFPDLGEHEACADAAIDAARAALNRDT